VAPRTLTELRTEQSELLFLHGCLDAAETTFVSPDSFPLQVGLLVFGPGREVKRHRHAMIGRQIPFTCEVLIVTAGSLEFFVWDYDHPDKLLSNGVATTGEILLFGRVAHSFRSRGEARVLEVKQGPYLGPRDKEMLDAGTGSER